ncbi:hypothetical protein SMC26_39415 [Actinomadura fulvescens]|uniref:Scaffolding protein n=1 Tax=Actinomadura fulvescens TaxID=46160 RepID=A0ABN3Q0S9_9ACTN
MSDTPTVPSETPTVPAAPAAPVEPATAAPTEDGPKWDGEFDAGRAARLIANLREESKGYKSELAEVKAKLAEREQAEMSEAEKLAQRATQAESELAKVRRDLAVNAAIRKHGLSENAAELLTGETAEEIDARAEKLAALIPAKTDADTPLPATLPIPGNGADPAAVSQLTREDVERMSPAQVMEAYRAGRLRNIGGK